MVWQSRKRSLDDSLITTLHHESGETLSSSCKLIICDGRNMTQEWGKAAESFQRRYSIVSLLGLVADMDVDDIPDLPPSNKTTPAQAKPANVKQAVASQAFQAGQKSDQSS